jgi:bromodomain-containing protein 8
MVEPDEPKVETPHPEEQLFSPAPEAMSLRRREGRIALVSCSYNIEHDPGKRKASIGDAADFSRERKRNREESETVEDDDQGNLKLPPTYCVIMLSSDKGAVFGPTRRKLVRQAPSENQVLSKRFQNVIGMLHSQISQHRNGNIFHNPIKDSEAPDYHDIVKRPMDLKTIKMRIKDGAISNSLEYQRDIFLMFANALMYNRPGSDIYNMAEDVRN